MTDADKLRRIADWIDVAYPNDDHPVIQTELREMARRRVALDNLLEVGLQKASDDLQSGERVKELAGKIWLVWFSMVKEILEHGRVLSETAD